MGDLADIKVLVTEIKTRQESMHTDIQTLNEVITGNGDTEKGLIVQTAKNTSWRKWSIKLMTAIGLALIYALIQLTFGG